MKGQAVSKNSRRKHKELESNINSAAHKPLNNKNI
jgi:hypothetical protein